jgi:uncharacterized OB-fold protein
MSERWFPDTMPPPLADNDTWPWFEAANQHRLVIQRCGECDRLRHPPGPICPECHSANCEWLEVSGRGEIYTFTIVHRAVVPEQELPFVIAVVTLEGARGIRMISNVVDANLDELKIGDAVELVWEDMSPNLALPRFRPLGN